MQMEQTEYSETLAFKLKMPVNHPEDSIQQHTCHFITSVVSANNVEVLRIRAMLSCKMGGPETRISQ
jgi:hypothetical protein